MLPSPLQNRVLLICLTCTLSWSGLSRGDEYLGAEAVLKLSQDPSTITAPAKNPLRAKMAAYKPEELSPEQAAKDWLSLLDQQYLQRRSFRQSDPVRFDEIFLLLPPPLTWEALKTAIKSRPAGSEDAAFDEVYLRTMAELLTDNPAGALQELQKGEEALKEVTRQYGRFSPFDSVEESLVMASEDPKLILPYLEREIGKKEGADERRLIIPDLAPLIGKDNAAALIKKALTQTNQKITIHGKETSAIAREVALENINALKYAPWELAESMEGAPLFEALKKKFPKDPERKTAEGYYLLSLIAEGKSDKAEQFLSSLKPSHEYLAPSSGIEILEQQGKGRDLFEFIDKALSKNPNLSIWDNYFQLAIKLGETERALKRLQQARSSGKLNAQNQKNIDQQRPQILLALDQVDEGIASLQSALAAPPAPEAPEGRDEALNARAEQAEKLTTLGLLLQRQPLVDEGLKALETTIDAAAIGGIELYQADYTLPGLLFKSGRGSAAEKILSNALKNKRHTRSALVDLCTLYSQIGRHADVITLLDEAPGWNVDDLLPLVNQSNSRFSDDRTSLPLGYIAAKAFAATGKPKEAEAVLQQLIRRMPGYDPAYELLLKLKGPAAVEDFDKMIAQDRFQERPLIWKAQLRLDEGKLEEAEKIVRQAIAIDPSDGEEGPNDRMRAYAILAKIRQARGDQKDAELYQNVMKAIRLSEEADRYASAGLLTKATAMYQEALNYFSDAYCIQSRLAKNLWELGRYQEAEAHYQRAYELMPDSFGRVESHCFGCENAFAGEKQQKMAERIFRKFAKETPTKPQVHYLLGYLLEGQGKEAEALASYREAVKLDPDYLNAWNKIAGLGLQVPAEERETAILQMLRLDPLGRQGGRGDLQKIRSAKKLWEAVASASKAEEPAPKTLYILKASREELERQKRENQHYYSYYRRDEEPLSPARAVYEKLSPVLRSSH